MALSHVLSSASGMSVTTKGRTDIL
ncbi:MAG: hypothetical protein RL215_2032, partial [Planctomycetota bacterium]